ncbi:NAD(P)-binding domain-containing protein [Pseudoclavibacter helvolus]|uniref:NAD(P)-binding domain-containing protein n=1 Tax=Pseudoclavibacter helvolus TaxID=255205 RepID=UPI003C7320E3
MTDEARLSGDGVRFATVVVIGAGQAGLSAGFHLQRRGFASALGDPASRDAAPDAQRTFVMLDANPRAGGAWQHRWASLTMATVNGIFDLPTFARTPGSDDEPSRDAVPRYFAEFEDAHPLPILRPVRALEVSPADGEPGGDFLVHTDTAGTWRASAIINATGTWNNPLLPHIPGQETFEGRQLHTRDYVSAEEFVGQRVGIVGGGISAVQQLEEISRDATTFWYTRREPVFLEGGFTPEVEGRRTIERVTADVEAGEPASSVVSYTELGWTPYAVAARDRGALVRRPMFTSIEPEGVREADGSLTPVDAILWATGFRADLAHLDGLGLRNSRGGITMRGTQVAADPRIHLIGFGPSQSTVGANRAGRDAVRGIEKLTLTSPLIQQK